MRIITRLLQLRRDKRGVSNVIVVVLSLIILVVIVSNVVLWSYEMNQLDWERMQENISIADVTRVTHSPWFTTQSEYAVNIGSRVSGNYTHTQAVDNQYETFRETLLSTYHPSAYDVINGKWWNFNYSYRRRISIANDAASAASSGYPVDLTLNTRSMVSAGKMLSNGNDLRIVYWDGSGNVELDRTLEDMNTSSTKVWFKTQAPIPSGGTDDDYYMYYGYPGAGSPPVDFSRGSIALILRSVGSTSNADDEVRNRLLDRKFSVTEYSQGDQGWTPENYDGVLASETCTSSYLAWLCDKDVGMLTWEQSIEEWKMVAGGATWSGTDINIVDNTHFITSPYNTGTLTIFTTSTSGYYATGWSGHGIDSLANTGTSGEAVVLEVNTGENRTDDSPSPNRRVVWLPGSESDWGPLNDDGWHLFDRAVDWIAHQDMEPSTSLGSEELSHYVSGTVPGSLQSVDSDYLIIKSAESATATVSYNPSGRNLLGGTILVSGTTGDLVSDNAVYMTFRSYESLGWGPWSDELLTNPGFEMGNLTGWTAKGPAAASVEVFDATSGGDSYTQRDLRIGNYGVCTKDTPGTNDDSGVWQNVSLNPYADAIDAGNAVINASAWLYPSEWTWDDCALIVRFYNSTGGFISAWNTTGEYGQGTAYYPKAWMLGSGYDHFTQGELKKFGCYNYTIPVGTRTVGIQLGMGEHKAPSYCGGQADEASIKVRTKNVNHITEVEFTGSSNTYTWTQLNVTVDSSWTVDSVNVVIQAYDWTSEQYSTSGQGYLAYTSGANNTDETKVLTITTSAQDFRNATGNWKTKIKGVKNTSTQFDFKADWIEFKPTYYSEYRVSTEFVFSNMTKNVPTQLNFTVVGEYDIASVSVTIQVWNYSSSAYVTSGEGYLTYTSAGANETKILSINTNPQFYTSAGNAKIRVTGVKTTTTQYQQKTNKIQLDYKMKTRLDVDGAFVIDMSTYPAAYIQSVEVQLRYKADDAEEKWYLKAYNWTAMEYSYQGFNSTGHTPTAMEWNYYPVNLTGGWSSYVRDDGTMYVKLVDEEADNNQTTIDIDFLGVRVVINGTRFAFKNGGCLTSHLVSLWVINSTHHERYSINIFINSAENAIYTRLDIPFPNGQAMVKVVTKRGNIAVYSSG